MIDMTPLALPTILTMARQALAGSPYLTLRYLACQSEHGAIVLRGRLATFYMKQRAQEVVMAAIGPYPLHNQIEVTGWRRSDA